MNPYTNKSQIEFSTYQTKWECWDCKDGYRSFRNYQPECQCDKIFLLNRIRIIFEEPVTKNTNYEISIEADREVSSIEFPEKDQIPVLESSKFNMYCNMELSADDETTIFEPHIPFLESFFQVKDELVTLRNKIVFAKKMARGTMVDQTQYQDEINKIKEKFSQRANIFCVYQFDKYKDNNVKSMLISKLAQIVLKIRIESLFDEEVKENPHVGRKTKIVTQN